MLGSAYSCIMICHVKVGPTGGPNSSTRLKCSCGWEAFEPASRSAWKIIEARCKEHELGEATEQRPRPTQRPSPS